jgi:FtsP/CotA-like multicopper oxidase with cupredoxin domain
MSPADTRSAMANPITIPSPTCISGRRNNAAITCRRRPPSATRPHWHGNVVTANQMRTDVGLLLPMGMLVADMVPDNPGQWFFHCHVSDHMRMGMQALYTVDK